MATAYTPTHYGPVGQQAEAGTTSVNSQTQGSLTQLVLQPTDCTFSGDWWNGKLTETWKGPWTTVKDLPTTGFRVGRSRDTAVASLGSSKTVLRFSAPSPGYDQFGVKQDWIIESCQASQLAAGDHGLLKVQYVASSGFNWSGGVKRDDSQDTWQLEWQPYSLRPYAFCKNDKIQDPEAKDYQEEKDDTAWRKNIEDFFRSTRGNKAEWEYQNATGSKLLKLNYAEQNIAKKVMLDRSAIWHYPVITHVTVSKQTIPPDVIFYDIKYNDDVDIGTGLDRIADLPAKCPYTFSDDEQWKWLLVGDTVSETRTKSEVTFTRRQVYQGVIEPDVNFYGIQKFDHSDLEKTRWQVAKI